MSCESRQTVAHWVWCFRLNRLRAMWVLPLDWKKTHIPIVKWSGLSTDSARFCCLPMGQPANPVAERSSRRGSWQKGGREVPHSRAHLLLNTLQRWIRRTPPQQGFSQCKHGLVPSCVFTTRALEWALFQILPLLRGIQLLKPLKQCKSWPTFISRSAYQGDWIVWVGRMWQSKQKGLTNTRREKGGVD